MKYIITILILAFILIPKTIVSEKPEKISRVSHQQMVWLYALEWCESAGIKDNVNEMDLDGTASYYAYQFKPATFRLYGERYGLIDKGLENDTIMALLASYELQRAIVEEMLFDNRVKWHREFPHCTKKLGLPPRG